MNSKILEEMKIHVTSLENRYISYTNKESAYFFTQSHETNHVEYRWFEGMNVSTKRIFGGYTLFADGQELINLNSEVDVYPHKLVRTHNQSQIEELWMIDHQNILEVSVTEVKNQCGIILKGVDLIRIDHNVAYFNSMEGEMIIAVSSIENQPILVDQQMVIVPSSKGRTGFYISVDYTTDLASYKLNETRENIELLKEARVKRLEEFLLQNTYTLTNDETLNQALKWININMNQLVTNQQGEGIYAGLPWFNEYWGRDQFISLPGATLVTGLFETARNILVAFTNYQNTDPDSKFYGRLPNILGTSRVNYHTTDATPRFNIQLLEYVKYTGDQTIIDELYPSVKMSIEGSIKHWVNEDGYLMHDDNETWMDARDANLEAYSPRDTRANDIQALWYHQLLSGVYFAKHMNDEESALKWEQIAIKLRNNFEKDFRENSIDILADRLTKNNELDFSLRPNQLFALDLIGDEDFKSRVICKAWQELVYPWGVASLDRHHPFFHPFHLTNDYHKDEAYHNGTIWTWLNGIAMQRLIEKNQEEVAFELFKNMNWQALNIGVVGGLGENMDAYPKEGDKWPKLTGAYLQAWSNAEHIRVWYQYFLGIRPNLIENNVVVAPRIPDEIKNLNYLIYIGKGYIKAEYSYTYRKEYLYSFNHLNLKLIFNLNPYDSVEIEVDSDTSLRITEENQQLIVTLTGGEGSVIKKMTLKPSTQLIERNRHINQIFNGIEFAKPFNLENHPVIKK